MHLWMVGWNDGLMNGWMGDGLVDTRKEMVD
jgi:hypothetical protein